VLPEEPEDLEGPGTQRSPEEIAAAREALSEARRRMHLPLRGFAGDESLESTRIAYEMELAEHRSTTERAHRAEIAAKDATIAQLRYEVKDFRRRLAQTEAEADRLRTALQVLTGRPLPDRASADDEPTLPETSEQPNPPYGELSTSTGDS
jgi:chromosome segregation ATPase